MSTGTIISKKETLSPKRTAATEEDPRTLEVIKAFAKLFVEDNRHKQTRPDPYYPVVVQRLKVLGVDASIEEVRECCERLEASLPEDNSASFLAAKIAISPQ